VCRLWILVGSAVLLTALAWPAADPTPVDSLPVSNYPMFALPRDEFARFDLAALVDAAGTEHRLDPREVGGTDQPVQAVETVLQAIRAGTTDELCDEIADALDRSGTVEVISVEYDTIAWFRGHHEPVDRTVHARCPSEPTE